MRFTIGGAKAPTTSSAPRALAYGFKVLNARNEKKNPIFPLFPHFFSTFFPLFPTFFPLFPQKWESQEKIG